MATRAEWKDRVERWNASGLEAADFAKREGLKARQLYWWKWKLGTTEEARPERAEPRFVPVRVVEPPAPPAPAPAVPPAPAWVEIALPNGGLVRILPGVDASTIACVMAAVARLSC